MMKAEVAKVKTDLKRFVQC